MYTIEDGEQLNERQRMAVYKKHKQLEQQNNPKKSSKMINLDDYTL